MQSSCWQVHQSKPLDAKWMNIFGNLETHSCQSKHLLLLVSKTLTTLRSNAFIERIFHMLLHIHLSPEIDITWTWEEKRCRRLCSKLQAISRSITGKGKRKSKNIQLCHGTEKKCQVFKLNIGKSYLFLLCFPLCILECTIIQPKKLKCTIHSSKNMI